MRERLPQYMVPSAVEVLPQLPLTPVGKLDRRALAARGLPATAAGYVAPSTDTEARLARLWQEALHLDEPVSVADDFFDLGGHSLLAMSLFPELEREFRVKLPLSMLFEQVTVASQAAVIDAERRRSTAWDSLVPLQKGGAKQPLFVFPDFRGDVLTYRQLLAGLDPDRPVYGVECAGLDGRTAPRTTIEGIASDCLAAIRQAQPDGPYLLAGYCFGGVVAYEAAHQLLAAGETTDFLGLIDATPYGRGTAPAPSPLARFRANSPSGLRGRIRYLGGRIRRRLNVGVSVVNGALGIRTPATFVDLRMANRWARLRYVTPESPLHVTLFRASTGSAAEDEQRRRRWEQVAHGGVDVRVLAAQHLTHHSIVREEHAALLAEAVNAELARLA
jgi:aspartate racemase